MQFNQIFDNVSKGAADPTKSSLLIPELYLSYFNLRCNKLGSRRKYLEYLIRTFLPLSLSRLSQLKKERDYKWNTTYQRKKLNLQKRSFTPNPEDWECLRQSASGLGVSMCFLFVFLMKCEQDAKFLQQFSEKISVERNSAPKETKSSKKFRKFSFLMRKIDFKTGRLTRAHQIQ